MRQSMKKLSSLLVLLALVCGLGALNAFAATPSEPANDGGYTYTVRVFPGLKGKFSDGSTVKVFTGVAYNESCYDLNEADLKVDDGYYVQGLRVSGRDRSGDSADSALTQSATAQGDIDYVVSYGIPGNLVQYTVRYLERGTDRVLHDPDVFYGNVGEKPVVAYRYVEGYMPEALSIAGTLHSEEEGGPNVFTFYYRPAGGVIVQNETVTDYGTTVVEVPGTVTGAGGVIAGGGGGGAGAGGGAAAGPGAGAAVVGPDAGPGGGAVDIPQDDTPLNNGPVDVLDIDEGEGPLGNLELDEGTANRVGLFGAVAGAMASVAGLGWLLWFLLVGRKRRKKEDKA